MCFFVSVDLGSISLVSAHHLIEIQPEGNYGLPQCLPALYMSSLIPLNSNVRTPWFQNLVVAIMHLQPLPPASNLLVADLPSLMGAHACAAARPPVPPLAVPVPHLHNPFQPESQSDLERWNPVEEERRREGGCWSDVNLTVFFLSSSDRIKG
jgi:hypothetical protein